MNLLSSRGLAPSLFALAAAASAHAQTPISGPLSGTLTAGVYVATGNISVATGQSLVLDPGVIVKFQGGYYFPVDGTLTCNGTSANPVIFTSYSDDSAGGDTNGNGPSSGSPGQWYGIAIGAATASATSMTFTEVRYAGAGNYPGIGIGDDSASLSHCTIRNCYSEGLHLIASSRPTVADCTFTNNGGTAIGNASIAALVNFSGNAATGNGRNVLAVTDASLPAATSLTLGASNMLEGAIVLETNLSVPATSTLTLGPGFVIKCNGGRYVPVDGTLVCNGTAVQPVVFTSYPDDSVAGDTNNNGPSSGSPGQWYGIQFSGATANASALTWTEVRYAGAGNYPGVGIAGSAPVAAHCTVRNCYNQGFSFDSAARPSIADCAITNCGGTAIDNTNIEALPGLVDNVASGNGRDVVAIAQGTLGTNVHLQTHSMLNGTFVLETNLVVPSGYTLTLDAGIVIKSNGGRYVPIDGTLLCNGTAANPVVFTSYTDDSIAGDTNHNGPSSGSPGQWYGIRFAAPSANASALDWTEVRYGGAGNYPQVEISGSTAAMRHCTLRNGYSVGLSVTAGGRPTVRECSLLGNGGTAIELDSIMDLPGFVNNTATGNGRSYLRVLQGTVSAPLTIGREAVVNGTIVLAANLDVQVAGSLDVLQGVIFKMEGARYHTFAGPTHLRGTAYEPVVFTAIADDDYGGDTNGNGASNGSPGQWYGLGIPAAAACSFENVIVRYAGAGNYPSLSSSSAVAILRAVRIEHGYSHGFDLAAAASALNLVAWACSGQGCHLSGGSFDLVHATIAACSVGIRAEPSWSGTVVNSIARQNNTNLQNFTAARFLRSDGGFGGQNGCIDLDPQFVDVQNGDLHLLATSPCLDTADYNTALDVHKDFAEYPRALDHALAGLALPDMGAYERAPWHMEVFGESTLGSTVFLTMQGPAGDSFVGFGLMDGSLMIQPYGEVLAGMPGGALALVFPFPVPVGTPIPLAVPNSAGIVGTIIGLQTLNLQQGNWAHGAFGELYRVLVRP